MIETDIFEGVDVLDVDGRRGTVVEVVGDSGYMVWVRWEDGTETREYAHFLESMEYE